MRTTVDNSWSRLLGTGDLRTPGIRVVRDVPGFEQRIFLLRLGDGLTIAAPSGIDIDVAGMTPDEAFTPDVARSLAEGLVLGPSWHGYTDASTFKPAEPCDARRVNDAGGFDREIEPAEWAEGGFHEPGDGLWYACFEGDERVAMGNMTDFNGRPADVGLVTRPDKRSLGYGARLASAMTTEAFNDGIDVVRYRALFTNLASLAVARKLGFVQDGANIVVRLDER